MIIHSKEFTSNLDPQCIQPNAVDIRLSGLTEIQADDIRVTIGEDVTKKFFPNKPVELRTVLGAVGNDGKNVSISAYSLEPRKSYQFETNHIVEIPEGMVGWLIIRSTLSRNGLIMSGGLYDSGYNGIIGGTLHNLTNGSFFLEENCRIGQFIMAKAENSGLYDGHYNTTQGRSI